MKTNFKIIEQWYKLPAVKFEIVRFLYHREFALIVPKHRPPEELKAIMRTLCVNNVRQYDFVLGHGVKMFSQERYYNFYYSIAKYFKGVSKTNLYEHKERRIICDDWVENHYKEMVDYDFFLDIDAPTFFDVPVAKTMALNIHDYFNGLNVPHEVRFSGMGFHIIIPSKYFNKKIYDPSEKINIYTQHAKIAKYLHDKFGELIDLLIYDSRRVIKIPYSLAIYEDKILVCSPLFSRKEIVDLRLKDYTPETIPYEVRGRGVKLLEDMKN